MDENDESLVFVTIWDCRTHVFMTSSVERTDLDFKISVALVRGLARVTCETSQVLLGGGHMVFLGALTFTPHFVIDWAQNESNNHGRL